MVDPNEIPVDAPSEAEPSPEKPGESFRGNGYDLASLGALGSALLMAFLCLTCNMGFYCLPVIPLGLGVLGLLSARQAVDEERTRLYSWIGVGVGGLMVLMLIAAIVLYFGLLVVLIASEEIH
jgi:hypothetical protein